MDGKGNNAAGNGQSNRMPLRPQGYGSDFMIFFTEFLWEVIFLRISILAYNYRYDNTYKLSYFS